MKENHLGIKKLHLNRKGNTLFAKNLLNFIEGNLNFRSEKDIFKEENGAPDDSTVLQSDVKKPLKNIPISNMNKLISRHLDANSLRNKFDILSEHIKGSRDIATVSETKIDVSFPKGQFSLKVFIHHLDLIVIEMVEELCFRGIMISQPNCQAMIFLLQKDLLLRLTCIERNGLLTVLITPTKVTLKNVLISSLDH